MANQIARELVNQNRDNAVETTFSHLRRYWDPAMRQRIVAYLEAGGEDLHEVARAAVRRLSSEGR
jgi:formate dehydrogenase subunit delta